MVMGMKSKVMTLGTNKQGHDFEIFIQREWSTKSNAFLRSPSVAAVECTILSGRKFIKILGILYPENSD